MDRLMGKDLATFRPSELDPRVPENRKFLLKFVPAREAEFRARMPEEITDGTYTLRKLGPAFPYCGYECVALNLKIPVSLRGDRPLTEAIVEESVQAVLEILAEWIPRLAKR